MQISNNVNSFNVNSPFNSKKDEEDEKLASGKKVNSASDNAAALQIINRLTSELDGYAQGAANLNDGISVAQVADASLQGITESVQRVNELTIQAGNGALTSDDRAAIQTEIDQITASVTDTIDNANFAGVPLFSQDGSLSFNNGNGSNLDVTTKDVGQGLDDAGFFNIDVTDPSTIAASLDSLQQSQAFVSDYQTQLGAEQNALSADIRNLATTTENVSASRSRLQDTDYAETTAEKARKGILEQASIAVQTQSNISNQNALKLLGA